MNVQTIAHTRPSHKPLHLETATRAPWYSVWLSLYLAQDLSLHALACRLTATLVEIESLDRGTGRR